LRGIIRNTRRANKQTTNNSNNGKQAKSKSKLYVYDDMQKGQALGASGMDGLGVRERQHMCRPLTRTHTLTHFGTLDI